MNDVVELNLSRTISVTDTSRIRAVVDDRIRSGISSSGSVELVQFHVLVHAVEGSGRHMIDFVEHPVEPGTALWIRPGQVQRWDPHHSDFDADVLVFGSSSIPDLPLFDRPDTPSVHLGADATRFKQLTDWIADDLEANEDYSIAAAGIGVALRLFARQMPRTDDDSPRHQLVAAFIESIDHNIEQRSVEWHARRVGASTRSIARATVESLGQRPKEVIDARVILEARRRLAWSDEDIAGIARALRFSEPANFTKFFRSRTGTTPSAFRQSTIDLSTAPS